MDTYSVKTFCTAVLVVISVAVFSPVAAASDAPQNYQEVDGLAIYLGVMPAEVIQGHPTAHQEHKMHGGVPKKGHRDHVVVALFDKATGKRIENAKVKGNIMELGMANQFKDLEPMNIANTITYGNYFVMPDKNTYHIKLQITRPGVKGVVNVKFTHQHFDK